MSSTLSTVTPTAYKGSCHCGGVTYTVTMPQPLETLKVMNCNCTLCTKNGYLNIYPLRKDVLITGEDNLGSYVWSETSCAHKFCKICGSSLFASPRDKDGNENTEGMAANVSSGLV